MFFDHYPYTNFHNINLDWVLQAVKAWGQTVEANDRAFRDLKEANEDFKLYVTNYLQDLDITDEINTKLDNMLASGILTPYFAPYVKGYVDNWLASHVTPTSPALDSTLTLSGAAARADSTGKRLKDLAYIDALSTPEVIASLNRSEVLPGYRVQGITYDYDGHYYVCGGSVDEDGTGVIVKMTKPDFTDAEISVIPQLGHANDITYYDGYLYVCTVGGGDAPQWGIYKINVNDFSDKTLISNAPENTIGISYRQGDFWILAPYRIYRTTDFTSYEVVVANTNDLLTAYGIPTSGRISQTLFRAAGYLIGWVCSFVFEDRHYGALTFFNSTGEPIAFKMFPAYHTEIQGAVYADMSIYLLADGNMVNVFRMDPRHLSYVQLKAGDDLNSFTGRGTLYSTGSNVSAALLNSPSTGEGFTVHVDRLGVYNTIQTARTNSGREMYRIKSFNSDTWGPWIEPAAEVAQIKDDLSDITGNTVIGFTVGKCIYTDGTTANITDVRSNVTYAYTVTDCAEGDTFTISGWGGNAPRLWAFLGAESDGTRPVLLNAIGGRVETDTYITAPENAQKLVVNVLVSVPYSLIRGEKITKRLDELSASVDIIQKEYTKLTFGVEEGKYVSGVSGGTPKDATNCATDYIRVRAGATVKTEKIIVTGNRAIVAYNKNRIFLRPIFTGSSETAYTFTVADDVYYIRATGATGVAPDVWISEPDIKDTENFYSASNILIPYDFRNSVNKKIVTYVDDDALDEPGLDLLKQSCDRLGIKCSIAAVGKILEATPTRVDYLKGLESQGFHICNHTYDHSRWYTDYDGQTMFTLAEVEQDLIKSIRILDSFGFIDASRFLIYPGSSYNRAGITAITKKWTELACTISSGNNRIENVPRSWLYRCPINANAHADLTYYQNQLESLTVENENNWIIYYSHSKTFNESGEWNQTLFEQVMQIAMDNGYTVMTLNEAWKYRKSMWMMQEAFGV